MAQVTLRINGYSYILGCTDGEEDHLQAMAEQVDSRIENIKAAAGPSGESRMLVMAALMMADDIFELEKKLAAAATAEPPVGKPAKADPKLGRKLGKLAKRAEDIAAGLEHP
jgi:cell division protein ZapA